MIWGTDVNVVESMEKFRQFLLEFCLEGEDEPLYKSQLEEIHRTQEFNISINCKHLHSFMPSRKLYQQLVHYPQVTKTGPPSPKNDPVAGAILLVRLLRWWHYPEN